MGLPRTDTDKARLQVVRALPLCAVLVSTFSGFRLPVLSFLPVLFGESDLKRFVVSRVLNALCALAAGPTKTGVARVWSRSRCETHRASASPVFARSLAVMASAIFFAEWLRKREDAQVVREEGLEYSGVLLDTCRAIARDVDGGAVTILSIRMRVQRCLPQMVGCSSQLLLGLWPCLSHKLTSCAVVLYWARCRAAKRVG